MVITNIDILLAAKHFCCKNKKSYRFLMDWNGGERGFVSKVVELDSKAIIVKNRRLESGTPFECNPVGMAKNGLILWASDLNYPSYNSAEVICRGGWMSESKVEGETRRFLGDGNKEWEEWEPIPDAEYKTIDDDYASGYADGLAGLPPMFIDGDRESYDHGYTDGFLSQCPR